MFRKKIMAVVLAAVIAAAAAVGFAGCKKKAASSASSAGQRGGFNTEEMEERYKSGLAELVTAGTITQAQSDKIYTALTERFSSMSGGSRPSGDFKGNGGSGAPSGMPSGSEGGQQGEAPSGSRPDGASGGQGGRSGFGSEALSSLVSDGTITQAQADTVMQKLMGNFRQDASGQSSGTSSQ